MKSNILIEYIIFFVLLFLIYYIMKIGNIKHKNEKFITKEAQDLYQLTFEYFTNNPNITFTNFKKDCNAKLPNITVDSVMFHKFRDGFKTNQLTPYLVQENLIIYN